MGLVARLAGVGLGAGLVFVGSVAFGAAPAAESPAVTASARKVVASSVSSVMPKESDVLERIGACEVYTGESLYDYIDGGAPQYLEYGFREAASQELRFHGRTYILDVYQMNDAVAAFGVFSTRRPDLPTTLPGLPRSCFAGYQGLVAQGPYYLEIQADENTDSTAIDMSALASLVFTQAKAEPARDQAAIDSTLASLPDDGRISGSERIARGPVSLGAAFGLSAGGSFLRVVEVVEKRLDVTDPKKNASWLVAGYHFRTSTNAPRTMLACLRHPSSPAELLRAIQEAGYVTNDAEAIADGSGWIVPETSGKRWVAAVRGGDLLLAISQLPADSLRPWLDRIRR